MAYHLRLLWQALLLPSLCLLGELMTSTVAADSPAPQPGTDSFKPRPIDDVMDLRDKLRENGLGDRLDSPLAIQQIAQYGSQDRFMRYQKADQFDRGEIQKEMLAHQQKVATQAFSLRGLPLATLQLGDFDESSGLALATRLGLRLFRTTAANGGVRAGLLDSLRPCRADGGDYWFLTKERSMAHCRSSAEAKEVEKNGGFLYHPDALFTDLVVILLVEREMAKQIGRNPKDYTVDVVIDGLRFEKPLEWGFYLRSALREERGDCDRLAAWNRTGAFGDVPNPHYFRVEVAKLKPSVSSFLVAVNLRDKQGKSVASYLADKQYESLLLEPGQRAAVLLKALRNEGQKEKAALSLIKMGSSAVPSLLEALNEEEPGFRVSILRILEQMGPKAVSAIPRLTRLQSDDRLAKEVRQAAVEALSKVADEKLLAKIKANEKLLASFAVALKDAKPSVRAKALDDLARMGPEAPAAIPLLVESLADKNAGVRAHAATALAAVGPEAVTALAASLKADNLWTRQGAVEALALLGPSGKKAIPALLEALKDKNVLVRRRAAYALGRMGSEAKEAIPTLTALAKDRDALTRSIAAAAVQAIEAPVQPASLPRRAR